MIPEAEEKGARGPGGLSRTALRLRQRVNLLPVAGMAAGPWGLPGRALPHRPAPLGTPAFPLPELLQLPPAWRIRVERARGAAAFGRAAQPLPPSFFA